VGNWISIVIVLGTTLALGQSSPPDMIEKCWNLLNGAAQDKNPDVRKDAAESLSLMPLNDKTVPRIEAMLEDRDVAVRVAVVTTLGDTKSKRTIPLLRKALADPVPEVALSAAKVLYQLHDREAERFLLSVVSGESKASSSYLSSETRNAMRMLHTPSKLFMHAAIEAIGLVPVPGLGMGISSAQGILSNPESSARASVLLLISRSPDPALADAVASSLYANEWSVRAAAAHVVATHPFPALREKLVPLLDDKKGAVRLRAAAAYISLRQLKKPSAPVR